MLGLLLFAALNVLGRVAQEEERQRHLQQMHDDGYYENNYVTDAGVQRICEELLESVMISTSRRSFFGMYSGGDRFARATLSGQLPQFYRDYALTWFVHSGYAHRLSDAELLFELMMERGLLERVQDDIFKFTGKRVQEPPPMYDGKGYTGPQTVPALPPFPFTESGQNITSSDSTEGARSINERPDVLVLDGVSYTSVDTSSGLGDALARPTNSIAPAAEPEASVSEGCSDTTATTAAAPTATRQRTARPPQTQSPQEEAVDSIASFFGELFSSLKDEFLAQPKPRVTRVVPRIQGEDTTIRDAHHLLQGAYNMRSYSVGSLAVPAISSHNNNNTNNTDTSCIAEEVEDNGNDVLHEVHATQARQTLMRRSTEPRFNILPPAYNESALHTTIDEEEAEEEESPPPPYSGPEPAEVQVSGD